MKFYGSTGPRDGRRETVGSFRTFLFSNSPGTEHWDCHGRPGLLETLGRRTTRPGRDRLPLRDWYDGPSSHRDERPLTFQSKERLLKGESRRSLRSRLSLPG